MAKVVIVVSDREQQKYLWAIIANFHNRRRKFPAFILRHPVQPDYKALIAQEDFSIKTVSDFLSGMDDAPDIYTYTLTEDALAIKINGFISTKWVETLVMAMKRQFGLSQHFAIKYMFDDNPTKPVRLPDRVRPAPICRPVITGLADDNITPLT